MVLQPYSQNKTSFHWYTSHLHLDGVLCKVESFQHLEVILLTANQINYWRALEEERTHRANENLVAQSQRETYRHNTRSEQAEFAKIGETGRHNLITEEQGAQQLVLNRSAISENVRHNKQSEEISQYQAKEAKRHNYQTEALGKFQSEEAVRHNKASERQASASLEESVRHNKAGERQASANLAEDTRHNKASENLGWSNLSELSKHNRTTEGLESSKISESKRHNIAYESESHRHNVKSEENDYIKAVNSTSLYGALAQGLEGWTGRGLSEQAKHTKESYINAARTGLHVAGKTNNYVAENTKNVMNSIGNAVGNSIKNSPAGQLVQSASNAAKQAYQSYSMKNGKKVPAQNTTSKTAKNNNVALYQKLTTQEKRMS